MRYNMKNEAINNETVNNTQEVAHEEPKLRPYATNAMRPVIIQKSIDGVRRAINLKMCEDAGVSEERLQQWKYNVSKLYEAACEYSRAVGTEQEAEREQEVWDIWRTIIRVGEENPLHPNMFVRRKDAENLRVLAAESDELYVRGIGFVPTVKGQEAFRSKIEIRLALRITGNKTLNDRQREVLKDYAKAERNIRQANDVINGYTRGKQVVSGIDVQIADAEKTLEELVEVLKKAGVSDVKKHTKANVAKVKELKDQKTAAEKKLKEATKTKEDLQEQYDGIIATLDAIEGATDEAPKSTETVAEKQERIQKELDAIK